MKAAVFFIGSIVLGTLILATSVAPSREAGPASGSEGDAAGSRLGLWLTRAVGLVLLLMGAFGLLRR